MSASLHYERLLAEHYTWMLGDITALRARERDLLEQAGATCQNTSRPVDALDLGAGPGIHAVVLAETGCHVTAIDTSARLLAELSAARGSLPIEPVRADLREFVALPQVQHVVERGGYGVVICMGDTITHLDDVAEVTALFEDVFRVLATGGLFVMSFRDLTHERVGLDRFVPVRSDATRVTTCFLEFDPGVPASVAVTDLVHVRTGEQWTLRGSTYRKLRLSPAWVSTEVSRAGLEVREGWPRSSSTGMVTLVAEKRT